MQANTNEALRERSGSINSNDPLVSFLYILMRDHIATGTVEKIMQEHVNSKESQFCNGFLAKYAMDIANRIYELSLSNYLDLKED
jgi:hypothetical protein